MLAHGLPIVGREVVGLESHRVGQADLANIMELAGIGDDLSFLGREGMAAGDNVGVAPHPLDMVKNVRIAIFCHVRHAANGIDDIF